VRTDFLDQRCVMRAERRVGDGDGVAGCPAAEERLALSERHEEMLASESLVVQLSNAAGRIKMADN
jgi:hypothetical protein